MRATDNGGLRRDRAHVAITRKVGFEQVALRLGLALKRA
jgi:hypothetical protein